MDPMNEVRSSIEEDAAARELAAKSFLASRLKAAREKAGLLVADMGRMLGKYPQTVEKWENGTSRIPAEYAVVMALIAGSCERKLAILCYKST